MILLTLSVMACAAQVSDGQDAGLVAAIETARAEAVRLGYQVDDMDVLANSSNTVWNLFLLVNPPPSEGTSLTRRLEGRDYWAVYFSPKSRPGVVQLGGDLFVFIDRSDGSLIGVLRGA